MKLFLSHNIKKFKNLINITNSYTKRRINTYRT